MSENQDDLIRYISDSWQEAINGPVTWYSRDIETLPVAPVNEEDCSSTSNCQEVHSDNHCETSPQRDEPNINENQEDLISYISESWQEAINGPVTWYSRDVETLPAIPVNKDCPSVSNCQEVSTKSPCEAINLDSLTEIQLRHLYRHACKLIRERRISQRRAVNEVPRRRERLAASSMDSLPTPSKEVFEFLSSGATHHQTPIPQSVNDWVNMYKIVENRNRFVSQIRTINKIVSKRKCFRFWEDWRLTVDSLTYNHHMSSNYATDVLMEPIFWFVDNFAGALGKFFIIAVPSLTVFVVLVAYWLGLPYWWERSPTMTVILYIMGHWILINIAFHYYKAVTTAPGEAPEDCQIVEAASICKKCISPRPPRAHHCSVCNTCILCMDHHCPWLNNCVGHFNRRYFYLYMMYTLIGVFFIICAGLDIGYVVLWVGDTSAVPSDDEPTVIGHPVHVNNSGVYIPLTKVHEYDSVVLPREHILPIPVITYAQRIAANPSMKRAVIYMAVINLAVLIALGSLAVWHGKLITKGETSIEAHINQAEMKRLGLAFRNPYDFGWKKNWKLFLGLVGKRTFFYHVILPSGHPPIGNGLVWHTIHDTSQDWP